jgi:hypothetical protein
MEYLDKCNSFEKVIKFQIFETYLTKIPHLVRAREHLKVKKLKIRVARKLDLIEPN